MKSLSSFFKKSFLFALVCFSSNILHGIDLRLNEKPAHIGTYDWCVKVAHDNVMEKRDNLLQFLGVKTLTEWARTKKELEEIHGTEIKRAYSEIRSKIMKCEPFSEEIKTSILNILERPYIKRKLGIKKVVAHNKIIAITAEGKRIEFVQTKELEKLPPSFIRTEKPKKHPFIATIDNTIFINSKTLRRNYVLNSLDLEASIGHELGHLLQKHSRKSLYICSMFAHKGLDYKENTLFLSLKRAHEIEADIIGSFDSPELTESNVKFFYKWFRRHPTLKDDLKKDIHPIDRDRAAYLEEIYKSMQEDKRRTKEQYLAQKHEKEKAARLEAERTRKAFTKKRKPPVAPVKTKTKRERANDFPRIQNNTGRSAKFLKRLLVVATCVGLTALTYKLFFAKKRFYRFA